MSDKATTYRKGVLSAGARDTPTACHCSDIRAAATGIRKPMIYYPISVLMLADICDFHTGRNN